MPLTRPHLASFHEVLLAAYSRDEFRRVVATCLDVDFDAVAPEKGFSNQLWAFVTWANQQDKALELVKCAWENNPTNIDLDKLWQAAQGWDPDEAGPEDCGSRRPARRST